MPIVSEFFGIVVRMYYEDHSPPHFHAEYHGERASFLLSGEPLSGTIESRVARRLIRQWAAMHRSELELNWNSSREGRPMARIDPLE